MKCPTCQTENPDQRKFCREGGLSLLVVCPKCKSENLPSDKFCGEFGISAYEYLNKAKTMFEEMDLQWDLKQMGNLMEQRLTAEMR
jgi:hypothetical protein